MEEFFQQFIPKVVPLTIYLESVSTIIITQGVEGVQNTPPALTAIYYLYLATIYGGMIMRVILTHCLKGYQRGYWIHTMTVIQVTLHLMLVLGSLFYLNALEGYYWIVWKLIIFILAWGSVMIIRLGFIFLVSFKILKDDSQHTKIKEAYWLSLTTNQQLRENHGRLCYEPQPVPQAQKV